MNGRGGEVAFPANTASASLKIEKLFVADDHFATKDYVHNFF
jgi:hypothetical protein